MRKPLPRDRLRCHHCTLSRLATSLISRRSKSPIAASVTYRLFGTADALALGVIDSGSAKPGWTAMRSTSSRSVKVFCAWALASIVIFCLTLRT